MADTKISAESAASALAGTEAFPAVQSTNNVKVTATQIKTWASASPTLVTPNLGTPSAGTLTNATGLPISTGVSGLGTGVATFLATPSSANLAAAITDETGTGVLVFANSPTFVDDATFGTQQTTQGALILANTAAGSFSTTIKSSNSATAAYTLTLPVDAGTNGYSLTTNGSGVLAWSNISGGGGGTPGGSDTQVQFNDGGSFGGDSGLTFDKTNNALTLGGATVTTSNPVLNMTQTWNDGAVTFTALKLNVTATAAASASKLLDLQVGGTSQLVIDKTGVLGSAGVHCTDISLFDSQAHAVATSSITGRSAYISTFSGINQIALSAGWNITWSAGGNPSSPDVGIFSDAAGILAIRNSTTAQTLRVYNTYTDASNYERGIFDWTTNSNVLTVGTQALGTGTARHMRLFSGDQVQIYAGGGLNTVFGGGSNTTYCPLTFSATQAIFTGGTLTASTPAIDITQTWNNAAVQFFGLKIAITQTAQLGTSRVVDIAAGSNFWYLSRDLHQVMGGNVTANNFYDSNGVVSLGTSGASGTPGIFVGSSRVIGWTDGSDAGNTNFETGLYRDTAYTLAQRNSTHANTFRVYNTYTDASNYERGVFDWTTSSNVLTIGTQVAGTGSNRDINFANTTSNSNFHFTKAGDTRVVIGRDSGTGVEGVICHSAGGIHWSSAGFTGPGTALSFDTDTGITRSAAGVLKIIDGSSNLKNLRLATLWRAAPITKTADWTVGDDEFSFISNRAATNTVTLPTASSFTGREILIKTIQAQTVVSASSNVVPAAGGSAGTAILAATAGKWALLVSDGTNWINMAQN